MIKDKLFFYGPASGIEYSYGDLFLKINSLTCIPSIIYTRNVYDIFVYLAASIIYNKNIILIDYDFKESELKNFDIDDLSLNKKQFLENRIIIDENNFEKYLLAAGDSQISLYTSGTTGQPKKVTHLLKTLTRMTKISADKKDNIWGFAYNPTHIAGLQVLCQALFNTNSIINLFGETKAQIYSLIEKYLITNISATPTFYRMIVPDKKICPSVKRITSGGERFDETVKVHLRQVFPEARILNIYASTEAGSLLVSDGEIFRVKDDYKSLIIIKDCELLLHCSLLGQSNDIDIKGEWYKTGDVVETVSHDPFTFKFISRKNEMINVGGYKVNPADIEKVINQYPKVNASKVYGKKNSVLGNILAADIACVPGEVLEKELRSYLKNYLQSFKIPRIINIVSSIEMTRTGKLKRI
jgi:acyl-coenzyme A synthetase/AMP-(fatty) acid ligase